MQAAVAEAEDLPQEESPAQVNPRSERLVPIITELAQGKMVENGLPNVMVGVMQMQMIAQGDPAIVEALQMITKTAMGSPPTDQALAATIAKLG